MSWTHVEDRIHKARKDHGCHLCGEVIKKGWTYVRRFGFDSEDGPISTAMHHECEKETRSWSIDDWESRDSGEGEWPKYDENGNVIPVEGGK